METLLELHHKIMLANKRSSYCKPVVAPVHFRLGGKCACIYMSVHVCFQKTQQKSKKTISYNISGYRLFLIEIIKARISNCYSLENRKSSCYLPKDCDFILWTPFYVQQKLSHLCLCKVEAASKHPRRLLRRFTNTREICNAFNH